jgi:ketosteroid isomerase-like protein
MTSSHDDPTLPFSTFLAGFAAGDLRAVEEAYEPGAVLVPRPGFPVTGADRSAANAHLMSFGGFTASVRHRYPAGDVALLIVDWSVDGHAPDGSPVEMSGTAADVARRGPDGRWRYVIDNPMGTA